ncbi:hypothetical protein [Bacillus wiedmannii]|uniref:Uncharacterized protein n=1 Tax=Bacillus wiedmannii TaxID=1890302 RepID=A0A2A7W2K3_9BACI|nr:hypothetical protein [Bacillus wiedmannii]PEJ09103.1 hypothetical protein CN684_07575 [Bacillus wiedmannii]PHC72559.1 hypothetical protein COF35_01900 [Bacillus wiedmannii]
MSNIVDMLKRSLDRTVPISDPDYIIGEQKSLETFDSWVSSSLVDGMEGFLGTVILGQIGNGKTHFLRYIRRHYLEDKNNMIGIYIPNMFISGPLVDALNEIYKSFFLAPGNKSLKSYYSEWEKYKEETDPQSIEGYDNLICRYLMNCNNREESELVLDYFSGRALFPDQLKFLRTRFGAKKNFISNENDFSQIAGDAFQFLQFITDKPILLLFDEVDKVYSAETNSVTLTRVGARILTSYRILFDHLNSKQLKGLICIGATPEAWDVLSKQTAFERRFMDRKLILKVPKTKEDTFNFAIKRLNEINYLPNKSEKEVLETMIGTLSEDRLKTWADVISLLRSGQEKEFQIAVSEEPESIIVEILENSLQPLTWKEIVAKSQVLKKMYPKGQPTTILNKLVSDKKIKVSSTTPKTYESSSLNEEF